MLLKTTYNKTSYGKSKLCKPYERMTDEELIELYHILINTQYKKQDNALMNLNKYLLKTGKIELIR